MTLSAAQPFRSLARLAMNHPRALWVAIVAHLIKDTPLWLVPIFSAGIIDTVVAGQDYAKLWTFVGLTVLVLVVNTPMHVIYVRNYSAVYRTVAADLRDQLAERIQTLSIGVLARQSASVIQTKFVRDVENIELLFQQVMPVILVATSILVGSLAVTAVQVPAFLLVYLTTVPIAAGLIAWMRRRSSLRNRDFRMTMEDLSSSVGAMATLIPITRAHAAEKAATRAISDSAATVRSAGLRLDRLNALFESASWVSFNLLSGICLGLAAWASMSQFVPVSPGQIVLLSAYFATLTTAVTQLVGLAPTLAKGLESVGSIAEMLEEPDIELNHGKPSVESVAGAVRFDRVGFTYPDGDHPAVIDFDLEVEEGSTTAFVGPSGSGKSTIINLVLGFLRPTTGRVLIDGMDLADVDLRSTRRFISVVPQSPVLFQGTILDNVTYGMPEVDLDAVRQALVDANAAEFVDELEHGWHSRVGHYGSQLSGGQKQRLAIARALIRDPRILLLDEATSALDGASENLVKDALHRLTASRTTLVVAHRLSTIVDSDRIVVMERGRIAEVGRHDALLREGGLYFSMFKTGTL